MNESDITRIASAVVRKALEAAADPYGNVLLNDGIGRALATLSPPAQETKPLPVREVLTALGQCVKLPEPAPVDGNGRPLCAACRTILPSDGICRWCPPDFGQVEPAKEAGRCEFVACPHCGKLP